MRFRIYVRQRDIYQCKLFTEVYPDVIHYQNCTNMKTSFQVILFILIHLNCLAQEDWTNINETSGLTDNRIKSIAIDSESNVWIGMGSGTLGYGIDKFDGSSFVHYNTDNSQIPSNAIKEIKIDQNDNLWISFHGGNATSIRKLTKFDGTNWTVFDTENSNIQSDEISFIQIDNENNIWTSSSEGFSKYDGETFINYPLDIIPGKFIVEDTSSIWCAYRLDTGSSRGLAHYNPITGEIDLFNQDNSNIPSYLISAIQIDSSGLIILGFKFAFDFGGVISNGGIATFDGMEFDPMMPFASTTTGVYDMKVDIDNNLWVSTRCEGLYKYDWNSWIQVEGPPSNGCSFEIEQDFMGYMWFGDVATGVWTNKDFVLNTSDLNSSNIQVYPNPASLSLNISYENTTSATLKLYSSSGVLVKLQDLNSSNNQTQISILDYHAGLYFWKIEQNGKILKSGKVILL